MAIDTKPFVELAERHNSRGYTHFDDCYQAHLPCAILFLAGALDAAQKRLDEYAAEIERLRACLTHLPESDTQPDLPIESDTQEPRKSFLEWRQELRGIIGPNVDTYLGETLNELEEDNHA